MTQDLDSDLTLDSLLLKRETLRECKCGCGTKFLPPANAPNKQFATRKCRFDFYYQERKAALVLLREQQTQEEPQP